jgi:hypothetical protein
MAVERDERDPTTHSADLSHFVGQSVAPSEALHIGMQYGEMICIHGLCVTMQKVSFWLR